MSRRGSTAATCHPRRTRNPCSRRRAPTSLLLLACLPKKKCVQQSLLMVCAQNATAYKPSLTHALDLFSQPTLAFTAKAKCCWGTKAAETMVINSIDPSTAYHYELVTFSEARSTAWKYEPYHMQPIDGPENGYAPGPWDIVVEPSAMFRNESKAVEVPHTAVVKTCHNCYGRCYIRCWTCHGRGRVRCGTCSGSGRVTRSVTQVSQAERQRHPRD